MKDVKVEIYTWFDVYPFIGVAKPGEPFAQATGSKSVQYLHLADPQRVFPVAYFPAGSRVKAFPKGFQKIPEFLDDDFDYEHGIPLEYERIQGDVYAVSLVVRNQSYDVRSNFARTHVDVGGVCINDIGSAFLKKDILRLMEGNEESLATAITAAGIEVDTERIMHGLFYRMRK